jgi:hypothetical protein
MRKEESLKNVANVLNPGYVARHWEGTGMKSFFRFDMVFEDLLRNVYPHTGPTSSDIIDVVVVSLGHHFALRFERDYNHSLSMLQHEQSIADIVVKNVCDVHRAKFGFYLGQWMECPSELEEEKRVLCQNKSKTVQTLNNAVREMLLRQPKRLDGCFVFFVEPVECKSRAKQYHENSTCTRDGLHTGKILSLSHYLNSKVVLLANAIRYVFRQHGMYPQHEPARIPANTEQAQTTEAPILRIPPNTEQAQTTEAQPKTTEEARDNGLMVQTP